MGCTGNILVVEQYCAAREAYDDSLRAMGYCVKPARCAAEALGLCVQPPGPPDLVLTNVTLPDGDGRALIQRIRVLYAAAIPAILVTGWQVEGLVAELTAIDRLFQKPLNLGRLEQAVNELLGTPPASHR